MRVRGIKRARAKPQRTQFNAGKIGKLTAPEGFVGARKTKRRGRRARRR